MKTREKKAIVLMDILIAIVAVMIFSTLIISMISNNIVENVKLKKDTLAMIYITEIFENIAIEDYDNVIQANVEQFIPEQANINYNVQISIVNGTFNSSTPYEDIMKKVKVTLTYEVGGKNYICSMERIKIKE